MLRFSEQLEQKTRWFRRNPWFIVLVLFGVMVILSLLRAYGGLYGLTIYSHDAFSLLDPAWRILNGQLPHIDFYSGIGPVPYLQTVWGMKMSHAGAEGMVYGQVAFGFVAATWTLLIARTRVQLSLACLAAIYVLLLAIAPFNVGSNFTELTAGMYYNRSGYALTFILLLEALAPALRRGRNLELAGGISTGTALAILLFTKSTYFAAGVLALIGVLALRKQFVSRWFGIGAAFCLVSLGFMAYLRFDFAAVAGDVRMMSGAKYINPTKLLSALLEVGSVEGLSFLLLVLFSAVVFWRENEAKTSVGLAMSALVIVVIGAILLFSNKQDRGLPLNAVLEILIAGRLIVSLKKGPVPDRAIRLSLIAGAILLTIGGMTAELAGIPYSAYERLTWKAPLLNAPGLARFETREEDYAQFVDDGLSLANRYRKQGDTITSLDFSDFFSYALRVKPAEGGANALHYKSTFSDTHHPSPERLFGAADIVMLPIEFSEINSKVGISRNYVPFLVSHFHLDGKSKLWQLYRRNR